MSAHRDGERGPVPESLFSAGRHSDDIDSHAVPVPGNQQPLFPAPGILNPAALEQLPTGAEAAHYTPEPANPDGPTGSEAVLALRAEENW